MHSQYVWHTHRLLSEASFEQFTTQDLHRPRPQIIHQLFMQQHGIYQACFRVRDHLPSRDAASRALFRSQSGTHAGGWLAAIPAEPYAQLPPDLVLLALRRRLRLPLPSTSSAVDGSLRLRLGRAWALVLREAVGPEGRVVAAVAGAHDRRLRTRYGSAAMPRDSTSARPTAEAGTVYGTGSRRATTLGPPSPTMCLRRTSWLLRRPPAQTLLKAIMGRVGSNENELQLRRWLDVGGHLGSFAIYAKLMGAAEVQTQPSHNISLACLNNSPYPIIQSARCPAMSPIPIADHFSGGTRLVLN